MRRGGATPLAFLAGAILIAACVDIPGGANEILSFEVDPLPSPGVVLGDSLRDTLGVVRPVTLKAFNFSGNEVASPQVRFSAIDRGIRVDSVTGIVLGDSVRSVARIGVSLGGLSGTVPVAVTLRPDSVVAINAHDSLAYSLTDSANISVPLAVRVIHGRAGADSSVASYLVSFLITSPADTLLARLVSDVGLRSSLDTTDAGGGAGRKIRLDVTRLTSLVDSVVVEAFVKYRGVNVRGSPTRLVLKVKPK